MRNDFAVFILSHGRANNIKTLDALRAGNYTGKIYIIIDDEDSQSDEYFNHYGNMVIQFEKSKEAETTDTCDNFPKRNTVLFARNAAFKIAKNLGLKYFLELDDDYTLFHYRYDKNNKLKSQNCYQLDRLFEYILEYLDVTNAKTITLAQGGDFIGGIGSTGYRSSLLRKAMNSFFIRVDNPFEFVGRMNDDVNTYVTRGIRGELFITVTDVVIEQGMTQQNKGGLTEMYLELGTYVKSFYTVMQAPSCTTIRMMGDKHERLHHHIKWNNAVPKIIPESYRKLRNMNG